MAEPAQHGAVGLLEALLARVVACDRVHDALLHEGGQGIEFQAFLKRLESLVFPFKLRIYEAVGLIKLGRLVVAEPVGADSVHQVQRFGQIVLIKQLMGAGKAAVEALAHGCGGLFALFRYPVGPQRVPLRQIA